ncbi:MAG TPA: hypothetical protein DCM08_01035 [Microscillaceae bacterium]|nr:hypothetical protein [Microscillaceae bacterium]
MRNYQKRLVPLDTQIKLYLGSVLGLLSQFLLLVGFIVMGFIVSNIDFTELFYFKAGAMPTTLGRVVSVEATGTRVNKRTVMAYAYAYTHPQTGQSLQGVSYGFFNDYQQNQEVKIEYLPGKAEVSRIVGLKRSVIPAIFLIFVIFPIVALLLFITNWMQARKSIRLLRTGEVSWGTLVEKTPTNTRINDRVVYRMAFEFEASDRKQYRAYVETHLTELLEDNEKEMLFFDPEKPAQAVMRDNLPGKPKIDDEGNITPDHMPYSLLILPLINLSILLLFWMLA